MIFSFLILIYVLIGVCFALAVNPKDGYGIAACVFWPVIVFTISAIFLLFMFCPSAED